jgi:predicted TIM-barrel fold metal-dependent hydrolase
VVSRRLRDALDSRSENLPFDILPCSNGEFLPRPPSATELEIMRVADAETERVRRSMGMSRRDFVRTSGAFAIGLWAIDQVAGTRWGHYAAEAWSKTNKACDLGYPGAQLNNLAGEFIFDIQSHHVESGGTWRVTNPAFEAFFAAVWPQAGGVAPAATADPYWPSQTPLRGGREVDPIENLSRYHYLKELFLDSSTTMAVLSAVPAAPDQQPLPTDQAAHTVDVIRALSSGTKRSVMHAFVMPNRGSLGTVTTSLNRDPVFMQAEFELMQRNIELYGTDRIRGWKVYTAWGDVPYQSGWYLDDDIGLKFCEQVRVVGNKTGANKIIAVHKGFALPGFDQRAASPRDIGPAARQFTDVTFIVYHSGYDSEPQDAYPGDDKVNSADRGVNSLIKSLRENGWDATRFVPVGLAFGNVPNVYAELGSTWRSVMGDPNQAAHLLGKLITYVGPLRIAWGTDSLWFGSPQPEIVAFRAFQMSDQAKTFYKLPHGLDGDAWDPRLDALDARSYLVANPVVAGWPTDGQAHPERSIRNRIFGRNAADAYKVDAGEQTAVMSCDAVQKIRDSYYLNEGTPKASAPFRSNELIGRRTAAKVLADLFSKPWAP